MRTSLLLRVFSAALLVALVWACGGGGGGGTGGGGGGGNNGVNLNTNSISLAFGQTFNFTGTVSGLANQVIRWSTNGGSIAPTGPSSATYTAPNTPGTYTVTATADGDPNKWAKCTVSVSAVGISIDPQSATMAPNATTSFNAIVVGSTNTNATFTASPSGGTVTQTGPHTASFRAPATTGTFTITAKASANPAKTATATITVATVGATTSVTGRVVVDGTLSGIQGVVVAFYNTAGSEVARGTTDIGGNFSAQVPISARRMHVVATSLSSSYYKQYTYQLIRYSALIPTCSVPLPTLNAGTPYNLPGPIEVPSSTQPPPPPPNGCG